MSFQEVILIPRSEYQRYDPSETKALNLELARIKNNNALTTHEKNTKYVDKLSSLMEANKKLRAPMELTVEKTVATPAHTLKQEAAESYSSSRIKELLPAKSRQKAANMYDRLRKLPRVIEREKTVVIDDVVLKHSLLDFVGEALTPKGPRTPLKGHEHFVRLLKETGTRANSVINKDYLKMLKGMKKVKKDSSSSPGSSLNNSLVGAGCLGKWKRFYF